MSPAEMPVGENISLGNERFPIEMFSEERCRSNHRQSPHRLAQRGGLGWCEAAAIIEDREWRPMNAAEAERIVRDAVAKLAALEPLP